MVPGPGVLSQCHNPVLTIMVMIIPGGRRPAGGGPRADPGRGPTWDRRDFGCPGYSVPFTESTRTAMLAFHSDAVESLSHSKEAMVA